MIDLKLYGLPADYWDTYPAKISAVTAADVQRVARKYLTIDRMQVVAVGDAGKITDALKKYGTVETFDGEGKPVMAKMSMGDGMGKPSMAGDSAGFAGKWQLTISVPGQELPGTLVLDKNGDAYKGAVNTALGEAPMSNIKVDGGKMNADITVNAQGQELSGKISGTINGGDMKGELALPGFPPITFTGKKQN